MFCYRFVFMALLLFSGPQQSSVCRPIKSWQCLENWRDCCWRWQRGPPLRDQLSLWLKKYCFLFVSCTFSLFVFYLPPVGVQQDHNTPESLMTFLKTNQHNHRGFYILQLHQSFIKKKKATIVNIILFLTPSSCVQSKFKCLSLHLLSHGFVVELSWLLITSRDKRRDGLEQAHQQSSQGNITVVYVAKHTGTLSLNCPFVILDLGHLSIFCSFML